MEYAAACDPCDSTHTLCEPTCCPQKLLPAGVDPPSSFETVGHIIHLNLREEQLHHKYLIGQV